ncbi:hypothetical protein SNEBB_002586 [Seison nebaliae]|nr:hypothetical protein SNEBB_002586 [Seison nebaliae]
MEIGDNERKANNLSNKIFELRNVAIDLEADAKDQVHFLGNKSDDVSYFQSVMNGSFGKMNMMVRSGKSNRRMMCYFVVGSVFVFVTFYYFLRKLIF